MKSSATVPKKIVDKNGRSTTVHVNPNKKTGARSKKAIPATVSSSKPFVPEEELDLTQEIDLLEEPDSSWRIHDYVYRRHLLHNYVVSTHTPRSSGDFDEDEWEQLQIYIELRNEFEEAAWDAEVFELPSDDGGEVLATDVKVESDFVDGKERFGYSNDLLHPDKDRDAVRESAAKLSHAWLMSLSSIEAYSLLRYTGESADYAREQGDGDISETWQHFEEAVANSPEVEPFVTYTGVNAHYVQDILDQVDSGEITFDRVFSSSLNPAQVNGFATEFDTVYGGINQVETLALEVETTKGAFMDAISRVPHEMEVMLPKGRYEVLDVMEDVTYLWGNRNEDDDKRVGRTIKKTLKLRYLDSE